MGHKITNVLLILKIWDINFFGGCSAQTVTRIGLLEEIPRSGVQIPCLYLMGHLGVRAPYATRRKLRYEANQVWMNTTFISQGPQSSGI